MFEIARESLRRSLSQLKKLTTSSKSGRAEIDLIKEVSDIFVNIIL